MFVRDSVVAHVVTPDEAKAFEAGYGPIEVDPLLIAWYRVDWAVQDLAGFAHEVLLDPARDPATDGVPRRSSRATSVPTGRCPGRSPPNARWRPANAEPRPTKKAKHP
jgi:hypothetical protein